MKVPAVTHFPVPNLRHMRCNYSPTIALFTAQKDVLAGNDVVRRVQIEDELSRAKPDRLRWKITTNPCVKALTLSTQRNRLRRRWTGAFQQALRKYGLDVHGRVNRKMVEMPHTMELSGTFEVAVFEGYGFDEEPEELVRVASRIVETLLRAAEGVKRVGPMRQGGLGRKGSRG